MKTSTKIITSLALTSNFLHALPFGSMGNVSASMGGAGVALRDSAYGLYYNPALLATSNSVKVGYSLGIAYNEKNITKIANINIKNVVDIASSFASLFGGTGITKGLFANSGTTNLNLPTSAITLSSASFSSLLNNAPSATPSNMANLAGALAGGSVNLPNGVDTKGLMDILQKALQSVNGNGSTGSGGTTNGDIGTMLQQFQQSAKNDPKKYDDLVNKIKEETQSSNLPDDMKNLVTTVAGSIDLGSLDIGSIASGGSGNFIKSITIKHGSNPQIDQAMKDIEIIKGVLKSNNFNLNSQDGLVFQFSNPTLKENFGALAVGLFINASANVNLQADPNRLELIVGSGSQYYKLTNGSNGYTYSVTDKNDYDAHSLIKSLEDGNAHKIVNTSFMLTEIPVGYARTIYTRNGNLSFGTALKFLNGTNLYKVAYISTKNDMSKDMQGLLDFKKAENQFNFGIDLGMTYELDFPDFRYLTFGLVGKYLNAPTFSYAHNSITIKPQARVGIAYNSRLFSVAFDSDLYPNEVLDYSGAKQTSLTMGTGIIWNVKYFDLRFGMMGDIKTNDGLILTGGMNILGFFDIAVQSGLKTTKIANYTLPTYFNLRLGGTFKF